MLLSANVLKKNQNKLEQEFKDLENAPEETRVRLIQKNTYTKPKLLSESQFDEDMEGQNFYLIEDPKNTTQQNKVNGFGVHPTSKLRFYGFDAKKTEHSSGSQNAVLNFMTRRVIYT